MTINIDRNNAILVVVDYQERLVPAMADKENMLENAKKLINGIKILGIPVILMQQYTKGLGSTVQEIKELLPETDHIEKITFSCMGNDEFRTFLEKSGRRSVILAGIETHICIEQTAIDLLQNGYDVYIPYDVVSSRKKENTEISLRLMEKEGVIVTGVESILFRLTRSAEAAEFRDISKTVK